MTTRFCRLHLEPMEAREVPAALTGEAIAVARSDGQTDAAVQFLNAFDNGARIPTITPFVGFRGTLAVSQGDLNGDLRPDVVVVAQGGGGHVKVFDGSTGGLLQSFLAFPGYESVVSVGIADVDGDRFDDVLVSASATGGHVKAFSGFDFSLLDSFLAFSPNTTDGVLVATGDADRNGRSDILVTMQGGRVPGVWVFDGISGRLLNSPTGASLPT